MRWLTTGGSRIRKLLRRLERLKEERDAVVVAHCFQRPEVQELADFTGGKLECALFAAESGASTVVVCGVDFMAELVAVLCPEKRVLLAAEEAKCPMVAMLTKEQLVRMRERLPEAVVVGYIKARAEQLELCDFVCTHAGAVEVVKQAQGEVVVVPDAQVAG
ncbi:MAG: quinolinate synthase NadA, partial [Euryarchaeota archaeon]|nr:quinolinate synthase NadA [Euryarchaeota archaeon]